MHGVGTHGVLESATDVAGWQRDDAVGIDLLKSQRESFAWFWAKGLDEILHEFSPITSYQESLYRLDFLGYTLGAPRKTIEECRGNNLTFAAPLSLRVRLTVKETGQLLEESVFVGEIPLMTAAGAFIINGVERVIISQLMRAPGVYFMTSWNATARRNNGEAKLIPDHGYGQWLTIETGTKGPLTIKLDRKHRIPVTVLLKAFGVTDMEGLRATLADVNVGAIDYLTQTLALDKTTTQAEAQSEIYRRLRPGEPVTPESAAAFFETLLGERRFNLGKIGRYKLNRKLRLAITHEGLTGDDLVATLHRLIALNNQIVAADDVDHLANRHVRGVGQLLAAQFRSAFRKRLVRVVQQQMSRTKPEEVVLRTLVNTRPLYTAVMEFFTKNQLSQLLDQPNALAELTNKRRLSTLGPGGLSRDHANVEARDVHYSHYGRICPIETPEGPSIGLIGSLASYAKINAYGFLEAPYRRILQQTALDAPLGAATRVLAAPLLLDGETLPEGSVLDESLRQRLAAAGHATAAVRPYADAAVVYLSAEDEEGQSIAQANADIDTHGNLLGALVESRRDHEYLLRSVTDVGYMDVSPKQVVSLAAALIPFLEHDDASRALMGANMQRQAVPLIRPRAPLVGTGLEALTGLQSGQVARSGIAGVVAAADARTIVIRGDDGEEERHVLRKWERTNQGTPFSQRPIVRPGQRVAVGAALADSLSTDQGKLALGQNVMVAFLPMRGYNYEDAVVMSERLVKDGTFTSVHLEEYDCVARDTRLGAEEITRDIPNVSAERHLRDLDEDGVVRLGAQVGPRDILVGKVTPKVDVEVSPEQRLLRAMFGEKARDVRDTSLRVPNGGGGIVIGVKYFNRDEHPTLPPGVLRLVRVTVAQVRPISVGDKVAGRHGNKGVVARILPEADMPFLPDGTPVDVVLSPLGVPSRMNVGQLFETHLGWAAATLGRAIDSPIFAGVSEERLRALMREAGLPEDGKVWLRDGVTGERIAQPVTVGRMYVLKLLHMVNDKVHARSTGPYSMVTQQPLGGKAQFGGQRFGEMEMWALEAYGASHILQEMLTIKSDDREGRNQAFEAIIRGEPIKPSRVPESFRVLTKELQSLGLSFVARTDDEEEA